MLRSIWLLAITAVLVACGGDRLPARGEGAKARAQEQIFRWKMVTTWPKNLPGLGTGPERFSEQIRIMSNGRLDIRVYGADELVGAFGVFDAVQGMEAEMGHGAAYYWRGKVPEAAFFTAVPFGLTAQEMNGWLYHGGGLELWQELYKPFGLVPFPGGNTGVQMGGWFNTEIKSIADFQGLRMRIPGLGGEVFERAGGTAVAIPGSEMFTALQTGTIDAAEWVGPYNALSFGLHTIADYYYYPGWQEPGPVLEMIVNQTAWDSLPPDLQAIVRSASRAMNEDMYAEFTAYNATALRTLVEEYSVDVRPFPDDIMRRLRVIADEVVAETAAGSPIGQRIYNSYSAYKAKVEAWHAISEHAYMNVRGEKTRP